MQEKHKTAAVTSNQHHRFRQKQKQLGKFDPKTETHSPSATYFKKSLLLEEKENRIRLRFELLLSLLDDLSVVMII